MDQTVCIICQLGIWLNQIEWYWFIYLQAEKMTISAQVQIIHCNRCTYVEVIITWHDNNITHYKKHALVHFLPENNKHLQTWFRWYQEPITQMEGQRECPTKAHQSSDRLFRPSLKRIQRTCRETFDQLEPAEKFRVLDRLLLYVLPRSNSMNTIEPQYIEPLVIIRTESDEEREERLKGRIWFCWGHVGDENKKTSEYQRFMF